MRDRKADRGIEQRKTQESFVGVVECWGLKAKNRRVLYERRWGPAASDVG